MAHVYEEREKAVYEEELIRPKALFKAKTARQRAKVSYDAAVRDFNRLQTLVREKIAAEKDFLKAKSAMETAELELNLAKLEERREERLFANKGLIKKDWQVAHAETKRCTNELATLKEKLRFLGVDMDVVGNSIASRQLDAQLPIIAPASGTVVQQFVSPGEIVSPDETIFSICQMDQVAVACQLPEADLSLVKEGAPIEAKIAAYGDRVFRGTIVYVGSRLDAKTRSVPARALLDNKDDLLKLNMFAKVIIHGKDRIALVCPKDALHHSGGKNVVYTRDHGKFIAKEITPGITCDDQVEVVKGLKPGENVITDGGVLVKMELMMEHKAL